MLRVIPEQTTQLADLLTENIDVYVGTRPDQAPQVLAAPHLDIERYSTRQYTFVGWNTRLPQFADARVRRLDDPRELAPTSTASEIRYDAVLDEWVAIASHRQGRTHLPPTDQCPLCPSRGDRQTEVPADDYDVVVFENRFPSFATRLDGGTPSSHLVQTPGGAGDEVAGGRAGEQHQQPDRTAEQDSGEGGADGEPAGVSERVQDFLTLPIPFQDAAAIIALN